MKSPVAGIVALFALLVGGSSILLGLLKISTASDRSIAEMAARWDIFPQLPVASD